MRKRLSVREFKTYCENHQLGTVIFSTENQDWHSVSDPFKIRASFEIVLISEHPSLVFLKSETTEFCIDRVRYVEIETGKTPLGSIIVVYCGGANYKNPKVTYTFIVR